METWDDQGAAEEGGGGRRGSCPPQPWKWGQTYHFSLLPPRNLEDTPRKNCLENARNSITPHLRLVETGRVRKIGALGSQRGPADSGALANWFAHPQIGFPPIIYRWWKPGKPEKRGPSAPKGASPIQGPSKIDLPPTRKYPPPPLGMTGGRVTGDASQTGDDTGPGTVPVTKMVGACLVCSAWCKPL